MKLTKDVGAIATAREAQIAEERSFREKTSGLVIEGGKKGGLRMRHAFIGGVVAIFLVLLCGVAAIFGMFR